MGKVLNSLISDACKNTFDEIKKEKKHRYAIFQIKDETTIDLEFAGRRENDYEDFLEDLQRGGINECRYGLYDFPYKHQFQGATAETNKEKLVLVAWCPGTAEVRRKMLYAINSSILRKSLGVRTYVQATDNSELAVEIVEAKLREKDRV